MFVMPSSLIAEHVRSVRLVVTRDYTFGGYILSIFSKDRDDIAPTVVVKVDTAQLLSDYLEKNHMGQSVYWFIASKQQIVPQ